MITHSVWTWFGVAIVIFVWLCRRWYQRTRCDNGYARCRNCEPAQHCLTNYPTRHGNSTQHASNLHAHSRAILQQLPRNHKSLDLTGSLNK